MSLPEKSILQADVNTQLIDSLTVHHTNDPKDSAYYLIEMTNYLKRTYEVCMLIIFNTISETNKQFV